MHADGKELWKLCLDLGLVAAHRRRAIDDLVHRLAKTAAASAAGGGGAEQMSKKSLRRLVLMETCICNGLAGCVGDFITAVDSSAGASLAVIPPTPGVRGAAAAAASGGYILRDVTRVHQWASSLMADLAAFVRDRVRHAYEPLLFAKAAAASAGLSFSVPLDLIEELATARRMSEGVVVVFRALVQRKAAEISAVAGAGSTAVLEGQERAAEALLSVVRLLEAACGSPELLAPRPGGSDGAPAEIEVEYESRKKGAGADDFLSSAVFDNTDGALPLFVENLSWFACDKLPVDLLFGPRDASSGTRPAALSAADRANRLAELLFLPYSIASSTAPPSPGRDRGSCMHAAVALLLHLFLDALPSPSRTAVEAVTAQVARSCHRLLQWRDSQAKDAPNPERFVSCVGALWMVDSGRFAEDACDSLYRIDFDLSPVAAPVFSASELFKYCVRRLLVNGRCECVRRLLLRQCPGGGALASAGGGGALMAPAEASLVVRSASSRAELALFVMAALSSALLQLEDMQVMNPLSTARYLRNVVLFS
jgi:hypothetical protein